MKINNKEDMDVNVFLVILKIYVAILWQFIKKNQCLSKTTNKIGAPNNVKSNNATLNLFQGLYKKLKTVQLDVTKLLQQTFSLISRKSGVKFAFSLVELMISITIIALIMAAFTPVMVKKTKPKINQISSYNPDAFYNGPPRHQEDCTKVNNALLYVKINGKGHCVTKYNVGDSVNGIGFNIPTAANVTTVSTGTTCGASNNYTAKCCWKGTTANSSLCDSSGGDYNGCNRTVCTWSAADAICSALGGRLPTLTEFDTLMTTQYSINKAAGGLQFCDLYSTYGSSHCEDESTGKCTGAYSSGRCMPVGVWSTSHNESNAYRAYLNQSAIINSDSNAKSCARSVRCILDTVTVGICEDTEGCFGCNPGEYFQNGECIECPEGYYCDKDAKTKCAPGTYNNQRGQASCKGCEKGYYCTGGTNHSLCPAGESAMTYQSSCVDCGAGYYCPGDGTKISCRGGTYSTNTRATSASDCIECPAGKYQDQRGQTSCLNCTPGNWSDKTGRYFDCPDLCSAGYSCKDGVKTPCSKGTYATRGNAVCSACTTGYTTASTGSTSSSACNVCDRWNGYGINKSGICTAVPNGWWWNGYSGWIMMSRNVGDVESNHVGYGTIKFDGLNQIQTKNTCVYGVPNGNTCVANASTKSGICQASTVRCYWNVSYSGCVAGQAHGGYYTCNRTLSTRKACDNACAYANAIGVTGLSNIRLPNKDMWVDKFSVNSDQIDASSRCVGDENSAYRCFPSYYGDNPASGACETNPNAVWLSTQSEEHPDDEWYVGFWGGGTDDYVNNHAASCRCIANW